MSLYQRNSQIGADFIASSVQETFLRFLKKFWPTKFYRFIQFFSQKLCIGIALIDTILSIAAYLSMTIRDGLRQKPSHATVPLK